MAAGELKPLDKRQQAAIADAVDRAEAHTGLQFCVFLGALDDAQPRAHAEAIFAEAQLHEQPAVLLVVAPAQRRIEIVTAAAVRDRISDADAQAAIDVLKPWVTRGVLTRGVTAAIDELAARAGAGTSEPDAVELPDVLTES